MSVMKCLYWSLSSGFIYHSLVFHTHIHTNFIETQKIIHSGIKFSVTHLTVRRRSFTTIVLLSYETCTNNNVYLVCVQYFSLLFFCRKTQTCYYLCAFEACTNVNRITAYPIYDIFVLIF